MSTNEKGMPQSRTYTVNDIAAILGIGRASAYKLANSGAFKTIRIGNMIRISRKSFEDWLKMEGITQAECDIYEKVKEAFSGEADGLEKQTETVDQTLQNVFDFMEAAFGDSQEMVAFITELNANYYSLWFIRENGSDQYYRHNKGLLFDDRQKLILGQMEELESTMKRGITDGV